MRSYSEIEDRLLKDTGRIPLGVIQAADEHTMEAVVQAWRKGSVEPVLYGEPDKTRELWKRLSDGENVPEIVACGSPEACAKAAVADVRRGMLPCLMKGLVETGILMKEVVRREGGLRTGRAMSLLSILESSGYHKLFGISDVGMMIRPTVAQKASIIENAVRVFRALGVEQPKVSVLAALEHTNPQMPETIEANMLVSMNRSGEIRDCIVEGPLSYDLSMDPQAGKVKNVSSVVVGDADILIVPEIAAGNMLSKGLILTGKAKAGGIICGAAVPIAMASRSASTQDKLRSILLAAAVGTAAAG